RNRPADPPVKRQCAIVYRRWVADETQNTSSLGTSAAGHWQITDPICEPLEAASRDAMNWAQIHEKECKAAEHRFILANRRFIAGQVGFSEPLMEHHFTFKNGFKPLSGSCVTSAVRESGMATHPPIS
ncbi:hypothetical protein HAX54_050446, partial [Datura stramonium]|nr:hypothetical protein [Datura stramonium]